MLSEAFDTGRALTGEYQAILVDEGQDFADEWYRLLLRALDPEANRLLVAFDSSQNIYKRRVIWRALGVQIVGHTRVLRRAVVDQPCILRVTGKVAPAAC